MVFEDTFDRFIHLGDYLYKHCFSIMVNETASEDYLAALDADYQTKIKTVGNNPEKHASWFSGQQIKVDIHGGFYGYWPSRKRENYKFDQL